MLGPQWWIELARCAALGVLVELDALSTETLSALAELRALGVAITIECSATPLATTRLDELVRQLRTRPQARLLMVARDERMLERLGPRDVGIAYGAVTTSSRVRGFIPDRESLDGLMQWLLDARRGATVAMPPIESETASQRSPRNSLVVMSAWSTHDPAHYAGDVARVLGPVIRSHGGCWLGCAAEDTAQRHARFCARVLRPLFRDLERPVEVDVPGWRGYLALNAAYARRACSRTTPDRTIWVHDYHLIPTARALRRCGHRGAIGLSLHATFPGRAVLERLPWRDELVEAMLDFDLVGFHRERCAMNFIEAALRVAKSQSGRGRATSVGVFPVAVRAGATGADTAVPGAWATAFLRRLLRSSDRTS